MLNSVNRTHVGILLVIVSTMVLTLLVPKANNDFWSYVYTIKYTCFGTCVGVSKNSINAANEYINYSELQDKNASYRILVESQRNSN